MFARGARPSSGGRYKFGERSSETLKRKDKYLTIGDETGGVFALRWNPVGKNYEVAEAL